MNKTYAYAIAGILIGLVIGAAIVWVVKPVPSDVVSKTDFDNLKNNYDTLQTNYNNVNGNLTAALAQLAALKAPIKIGLVLATGGVGDKSFNDIAYAGMIRAKTELNITFAYQQPAAISDYESAQRGYAQDGGYALIVCIGFDQADALDSTALAYPNQKFAIVDMPVDQPNVASLLFRANEGSFLTGVLAGMLTNTGKSGFVG